ncbi:YdcF family protein [Psychrobacillus sp. BL-248-WT-3]|uniref:YdcF family protein n=1 Tax=Psychrobacillus sp. BL-248-WT-3 TaxID=2725306 RepID=UPI00146B499A|nr:YdcF family protein [Psychrobacillus sp. BL-248-WT-3]NME05494.1 YdcF family protein [Psychrobacillus sp. BL-248-WT-3]
MSKKKRWIVVIPFIIIASSGLGMWMLTSKWLEDGLKPKADGSNEYAIVLGAKVKKGHIPSLALLYRLEAALDYAEKYPSVKLVVTGGQGQDEDIEEAIVMKNYLVENGIMESRIIVEDQSTSTYENLLYSQQLLPDSVTSVTIITSDFHLQRAKIIAEGIGWDADVVAARTPQISKAKLRLRERAALLKTFVSGE